MNDKLKAAIGYLEKCKSETDHSFKTTAYQRAIRCLKSMEDDDFDSCDNFSEFPGIGNSINSKILGIKSGTIKFDPIMFVQDRPKKHRKSFTTTRLPLKDIRKILDTQMIKWNLKVRVVGSIRRQSTWIADIDFVCTPETYEHNIEMISKHCVKVLVQGAKKTSFLLDETNKIQIDLNVVSEEHMACGLLHHTGSMEHNTFMRFQAKKRGWKLNQYNLFDENNKPIPTDTEQDVFDKLGMKYLEPHKR